MMIITDNNTENAPVVQVKGQDTKLNLECI